LGFVRAKYIFSSLMLIAALESVAAGQSGNGYAAVGIGSNSGSYTDTALGGEFVIGHTIGVGGEVGAVLRHSDFGFVSLDGSVHLSHSGAKGKVDPFVIGGYTRAITIFSGANGANFGGGVNYWLTRHFGVRAEFRDMRFTSGGTYNFWALRGGIAFR
jgi:hypothetical protein